MYNPCTMCILHGFQSCEICEFNKAVKCLREYLKKVDDCRRYCKHGFFDEEHDDWLCSNKECEDMSMQYLDYDKILHLVNPYI